MVKNIEDALEGFRKSHYGKNLVVKKVERDKTHSYHHITGQGYSLTLWQEGINGTRDNLEFLNKRGFVPHELDPNTYYRILK